MPGNSMRIIKCETKQLNYNKVPHKKKIRTQDTLLSSAMNDFSLKNSFLYTHLDY